MSAWLPTAMKLSAVTFRRSPEGAAYPVGSWARNLARIDIHFRSESLGEA